MKERIIQDKKAGAISSTTACLALLVMDADTPPKEMAKMLDIPLGTPSSIKTRFNQNFYKEPLDTAIEYLSKLESETDSVISDEAKLMDSWSVPPQPPERKKELSAPMTEAKGYSLALESKKNDGDSLYNQVLGHLNEFGLYEELVPYIGDKIVIDAFKTILNFTEKNSGIYFKLPKIFTWTLKTVVNHHEFEGIKNLRSETEILSELNRKIDEYQAEIDKLNNKVLEMFKAGSPEGMNKLYESHKELIISLDNLKEKQKELSKRVSVKMEIADSIMSAKTSK